MKLLLDTHAFLWFTAGDSHLSRRARRAIEDAQAVLLLSAASVWEIAIKSSLGRLSLPTTAADFLAPKLEGGLQLLAIDWRHAAAVETLPFHHRDPFDRLLIAQASIERLTIVTSDPVFRKYGVPTVW